MILVSQAVETWHDSWAVSIADAFAGSVLSMACTIAIRYSAVRRQGFTSTLARPNWVIFAKRVMEIVFSTWGKDDGSEMCILDYTMQQEMKNTHPTEVCSEKLLEIRNDEECR